ncbi:MAG TPA: heme o synthase [Phycisphaerales bacterium]|nr:heme o synthase [Phycisphaerales bacterium]
MTRTASTPLIAPTQSADAPARSAARALLETTKPGITRLVTMTAGVGFVLAASGRSWAIPELVVTGSACLAGTALSAAGANSLNQWMERSRDARMDRTRKRPIPSGDLSPRAVAAAGAVLCVAGLAVLLAGCGLVPMLVSLACIVSYLAFYTPMKPATTLATFVGAIPGALPPMIGSAAASTLAGWDALREPAGLALFCLMFVWQVPHFLALAWLYRDDYAKGGYAVLPVVDPKGDSTAWTVALWSAALIPATLLPAVVMPDLLGWPYVVVAGLSGAAFFAVAVRLVRSRARARARAVFLASIMHLPALLVAMTAESLLRAAA